MIIGNGQIANSFLPYKNDSKVLIFASGVSNSQESDSKKFTRERTLLRDSINDNKDKIFVYFSTCSVYDLSLKDSKYVKHKIEMENLVVNNSHQFYILRLPQVVGDPRIKNTNLVCFLFSSILNNKKIDVYSKSTRNFIDLNNVFLVADFLIQNKKYINEITNIASPHNVSIRDIIQMLEEITSLSLSYDLLDAGYSYEVNIDKIHSLDIDLDIFSSSYLKNILKNYYLRLCAK